MEETYDQFVEEFNINLKKRVEEKEFSHLIFLCIGTDRITGDAFGPLVGNKLIDIYGDRDNIHIIGSLENPVVASNIDRVMIYIKESFESPFIIAIDSAVSNRNSIGKIIVSNDGINLGSGLDKKSLKVGDIGIKGIVSKNLGNPKYNFILLQNTSLNLIMNMVNMTVRGIHDVL